ncbi:MAG: hypothetical protein K6F52_04095 [Clostridia bacterium]|nr:hypothetical protein [Clostridia bacterium]
MQDGKNKLPKKYLIMRIAIPVGLVLMFAFVALHYYNVIFAPMIAAESH